MYSWRFPPSDSLIEIFVSYYIPIRLYLLAIQIRLPMHCDPQRSDCRPRYCVIRNGRKGIKGKIYRRAYCRIPRTTAVRYDINIICHYYYCCQGRVRVRYIIFFLSYFYVTRHTGAAPLLKLFRIL